MDNSNSNSTDPSLELVRKDVESRTLEITKFKHDDAIDDGTPIREVTPVVKIRDAIFAVKGDISIIGGLPKAGKTSVCAFILATALKSANTEKDFDSLFIESTPANGNPVVYIDTEQPKAYTNKLRKLVMKLLKVEKQPPNLGIVNLRKYDSKQKLEKVNQIVKDNPNIHLLIIDGVADLIKDPNDTKESFGVIENFMMLSDIHDTAIILHIHENPGTSGKLRGNLGSEAERKCGGAISIKKIKEKGVHVIESKVIRGSKDFDPVYFRYSETVGHMASLDEMESSELNKSKDKTSVKKEKLILLAKKCLSAGPLNNSDLIESLMKYSGEIEGKPFKERTAENRITDLKKENIIQKDGQLYKIADIYIPQP